MSACKAMLNANIAVTLKHLDRFEHFEYRALGANLSSAERRIDQFVATVAAIIPRRMSIHQRWFMLPNRCYIGYNVGPIPKLGKLFDRRKRRIKHNGSIHNPCTGSSKYSTTTIFIRLLHETKSTHSRNTTKTSDTNTQCKSVGAYFVHV